jgi:hypothetical protein
MDMHQQKHKTSEIVTCFEVSDRGEFMRHQKFKIEQQQGQD